MGIALQTSPFFQTIEYLAIFFCGMSGGLTAIRKKLDLLTILITAWLTALGGGILRDLLLGAVPPAGISDRGFVFTAFASGCVVAVIHPEVNKLKWTMLTIDALSIGLFAVNGASKALMYNTSGLTAVFLGTFTAIGGGTIRDILLNDVPQIIRDRHWYIVPSVIGCVLTVVVWRMEQYGAISFHAEFSLDVVIVLLVVALRLASVKFDIELPGAVKRKKAVLLSTLIRREVRHRASLHDEHPTSIVQEVDSTANDDDGSAMQLLRTPSSASASSSPADVHLQENMADIKSDAGHNNQ
ncbi:trimeric intracellular cation channel family protein [Bifidobacterium gallicum]|uniref:Membrane protein n=1 Tax=Bifidobacterium gallicum DSM 20093 = LMG 11596 TaxID=561180 RepID=D1NSE8_9BIFI|nr:hypothetical protein BIFGAL_02705 [Bifidobacterium gallicum DSM 20093 = LMG 11596]KFI58666.1 membrane protein [Bifidobacterium gallicum DSM 20093 = LMG 11596]